MCRPARDKRSLRRGRHALEALCAAALLGPLTTVVYFMLAESANHQDGNAGSWLKSHWDDRIPFVPPAVWVYASWYPAAFSLAFAGRCVLRAGYIGFALAFGICSLGHMLWPVSIERPIVSSMGLTSSQVLAFVYAIDPPVNLFPSFHAAGATLIAVLHSGSRLAWVWALAVCASCLLIKQHFVLDIAAGMVVGGLSVAIAKIVTAMAWADDCRALRS